MTPYEIPLTPAPQKFSIQLGGTTYQMRFYWCEPAACWVFDLMDKSGNAILLGVPVVTGVDLLAQYAYLQLGGSILVQTDYDPDAVPTFDNLGTTGHVFFLVS